MVLTYKRIDIDIITNSILKLRKFTRLNSISYLHNTIYHKMITQSNVHIFQYKHHRLTSTTSYGLSINRFKISRQSSPRGGGGMERKRHRWLWQSVGSIKLEPYQTDKSSYIFLLTFGFAWGSRNVGRAFLEVDYIVSDKLGSLARFGISSSISTYTIVTYPRWHTQQLGQRVVRGRAGQRKARRESRE